MKGRELNNDCEVGEFGRGFRLSGIFGSLLPRVCAGK